MLSLLRWSPEAVREAVKRSHGLDGLRPGDRVMIKPNLPLGGAVLQQCPGMSTSSEVVEDIVELLRDCGVGRITIAEGSVEVPAMGSSTSTAFAAAGYERLRERHGVTLLDLNAGEFVERRAGDQRFSVASAVLEQDFLINAPCLKTHVQARVSLGMKNLKGVLDIESKKACHKHGLSDPIAELSRVVKSDLVVVDGLLALELGPISDLAHEAGLILAGTDVFEADVVGSMLLGIDPREVEFLRAFGRLCGRSPADPVEISGESVEDMMVPCRWYDDEWTDLYSGCGVQGFRVMADRTKTACSMCLFVLLEAFHRFGEARPGHDFSGLEVVLGKNRPEDRGARNTRKTRKTLLCGTCPIRTASGSGAEVRVRGCPPAVEDILKTFEEL